MEEKFLICKHCGNLVSVIKNAGVPIFCCGEEMTELIPGTVEASREKHIPVVTVNGSRVSVQVGSAAHPMLNEHYIEWIMIQTDCGCQRKALKPGSAPNADFILCEGETLDAVYAYCNIHGLWKAN